MSELLVEIFSEEIPARMQKQASADLERLVCDYIKKEGLTYEKSEANVTPRRLTLWVDGLPKKTDEQIEERKGPSENANDAAINGFAKSCGINRDELIKKETPKGEFYFATVKKESKEIKTILKDAVLNMLQTFPWPKSMRWGSNPERWVRPINSILCLFDKKVIPFVFAGVESGNITYGHRFLAPDPIKISDYGNYKNALKKAKVVLSRDERKKIIMEQAGKLAADAGYKLREDNGLLEEVAGLVEYPTAYMGNIETRFMELPEEILITSMKVNQKYFVVSNKSGKLAPKFVFISNMITKDDGKQIIAGNERVLRARLSDAFFFWDQDRKSTLLSRVSKLKERIFHAKLGSMHEKVERMITLAVYMARDLKKSEPALVDRAVLLSKADLSTGMVGEFPELQGIMGRYYALHDGEDEMVADAIAEHYSPLGPNDKCPSSQTSIIAALADKIDTLTGFWLIDQKPTGSKDPFALRRAALGIIRIIIENKIYLDLRKMIDKSRSTYKIKGDITASLLSFIEERMKVYLKDKGLRHDYVNAVLDLKNSGDLMTTLDKVYVLNSFLKTDDGINLLAAYKRAFNILKIEQHKDNCVYAGEINETMLRQSEEGNLYKAADSTAQKVDAALKKADYTAAMNALSFIRKPLDAFFAEVLVNDQNASIRANRLNLLKMITSTMEKVAAFSVIEG